MMTRDTRLVTRHPIWVGRNRPIIITAAGNLHHSPSLCSLVMTL